MLNPWMACLSLAQTRWIQTKTSTKHHVHIGTWHSCKMPGLRYLDWESPSGTGGWLLLTNSRGHKTIGLWDRIHYDFKFTLWWRWFKSASVSACLPWHERSLYTFTYCICNTMWIYLLLMNPMFSCLGFVHCWLSDGLQTLLCFSALNITEMPHACGSDEPGLMAYYS